jgi:hypothetical protein
MQACREIDEHISAILEVFVEIVNKSECLSSLG